MKSRTVLTVLVAAGTLAFSGAVLAQTSGGSSATQPQAEGTSQTQMQTTTQSQAGAMGDMMDPSSMNQEDIRKIQQALQEQGHDLTVDGVWGEETETALREFQEQQGMEASGELDQETLAALEVDLGTTAEAPGATMGTTGSTATTPMPSGSGAGGAAGGTTGTSPQQ